MEIIAAEFEAFDIDAHIGPDGLVCLSLITDRGRVAIHMQRQVLESLVARSKRAIESAAPLAPLLKDV
jgi:hypothetical protein